MPTFNIVRESKPSKTFRVASVIGKFDLPSEHIVETFNGDIDLSDEWQIGLIVGKSGTGKTTIAKELFPDAYITNFQYIEQSILDDMPKNKSVEEITSAFNAVGFSSPPSWLKPYTALSNGQKMRVDLANAILSDNDLFVFDEFTSVVDRNVAQIGSFAMQKMFAKHHYLSHTHNNAANVYLALINDNIAGYLSVLHFPHPKAKNIKKVHRLVILPDYQGAGFGIKFLNEIGNLYKKQRDRFTIMTSAPSLIHALKKNNQWNCIRYGRVSEVKNGVLEGTTSKNRITASFELIKTS